MEVRLVSDRKVTQIAASEIPPEDIKWLLKGFLMEGLVGLAGRPKVGKSTLTSWMAARVSTGEWGKRRKEVFVLSLEEDAALSIVPRLEAAGADMAHVSFPGLADPPLRLPRDLDVLGEHLLKIKPRLVIMDSAQEFISRPGDVRPTLSELKKLAKLHKCCIVLICHFNRTGTTLQDALYGSSAFFQSCRAMAHIGAIPWEYLEQPGEDEEYEIREPTSDRVLCMASNNDAALPTPIRFTTSTHLVQGIGSERMRFDLVGPMTPGPSSEELFLFNHPRNARDRDQGPGTAVSKKGKAMDMLRHLLAFEERKRVPDILSLMEAAGISEKTTRRAAKDLGVESNKDKDGWWWSLPVPVVPDTPPQ